MRSLLARPLLAVALFVPGIAQAVEVVVPPLVPRGATEVRDVANISQLIGSELDFMPDVDKVIELTKTPTGYGVSCLDSSSCLAKVGRTAGGDRLLGGTLRITDDRVTMDMVYFDVARGRFIRRQSFELPNRPEDIADSMGDIVRELVTGEVEEEPGDAAADFDLLDFDDEFEVDFDQEDFDEAKALEARRKREEAEEQARLEEERRRRAEQEARDRAEREARERAEAEERRRAEEAERRRRAEEERRRAEEDARRRAAAEEERRREAAIADAQDDEEEDFDPSMISFGSSSIVVEDEDEDDKPVTSGSYYEEVEDEPDLDLDLVELDEPDPPRREDVRVKPVKPSRETTGGGSFDDEPTAGQIAVRGGFAPYYNLSFITVGAEGAFRVPDTGVHLLVGYEAWAVQRAIPERFQEQAGTTTEWNTMETANLGVIYKLQVAGGRLRPYAGADAVFSRYYVDPEGSALGSWAVGARARGGVDLMVVRNFGLNLNVAVGGWSGKDWEIIEKDVKNAGLVPQVSAGTVFAF